MKRLFVIFASIAVVAAFAVTASAAEWSLYGNARIATFYVKDDFGDSTFKNSVGDSDDTDLQWDMQSNSRIGANIKGDNIKAQFELGLKGSTGDVDVGTRRLWGQYDFGGWQLKLGKDYTPLSQFISGQVFDGDLGLLGVGTFYGFRKAQIAFTFGSFEVALISPSSGNVGVTGGDVDETMPLIEAKWGMKSDMWNLNIRGGYQTYDIQAPVGSLGGDQSVDSYAIALDGGVNFGQFYINAAVSQGQNTGVPWYNHNEFDVAPGFFGYPVGVPIVDPNTGKINDVDTLMWSVIAGFKMSDTMTLEGGLGMKENEYSSADLFGVPNLLQKDDIMAYYVQLVWQVAPGLFIIPEAGVFDYGDTLVNVPAGAPGGGSKSGDTTYFGAKWQINF